MNHGEEIKCQYVAFIKLSKNHPKAVDKVLVLHPELADILRKEINKFEAERGCVPTADELIWLTSETLHEDIREYFSEET